jgi:NAD(P)-dependent dehydrogenase (short-subunit alcohol dehydrogenase family)
MSKLFDFEGERALILGSGGIGGSIAVELAERGAEIVIADISQNNLDKVSEKIQNIGGKVHSIQTNITNRDDVVKLYEQVQKILPNITISVNSIGLNEQAPAVDTTQEQWDTVINGFLNNLFWSNQQAAKIMLPQKKGKILNIASMSGVVVTGDQGSSYAAVKAAVIHLSRALAIEWIKDGVYVNALSPATVNTPLTQGFLNIPGVEESIRKDVPLGRLAEPADMVGPAVFLLSKASDYVVGHNLIVDGGYTLR